VSAGSKSKNSWRTEGWAELPFFLAVARAGSLRAAATDLGVNHVTVNRSIKLLEDHYGARLFDRSCKGLSLTPAGEGLMAKAQEAETAVMNARRRVSGLDAKLEGRVALNISAWNAYYNLVPALPRFRVQYPKIDLTVSVSNDVENLATSASDVSYRAGWRVDEDVTGRKLFSYHTAVLASQAYVDRHWHKRGPNGEGLHWIGQSTLWPNPRLEELNLFPKAERVFDVVDPILINEMLKHGMGMCIMPFGTLEHVPGLTVVPETPIAPDRSIWVLLQTDLKRTARVRALADFLAEVGLDSIALERKRLENYQDQIL